LTERFGCDLRHIQCIEEEIIVYTR
jgi:hypothetical protein